MNYGVNKRQEGRKEKIKSKANNLLPFFSKTKDRIIIHTLYNKLERSNHVLKYKFDNVIGSCACYKA